jgi:hypothetical protein
MDGIRHEDHLWTTLLPTTKYSIQQGSIMTVKILTDVQKHVIVHQYCFVKVKVKDLAVDYKVSRRTINRVLVEMGVAPVRKPKAVPLYTQQVELPITMVEPTFMEAMKEFFKSIFGKKQQQTNVQASK